MIIKEIFIQNLLASAKFSVIVILLLALTKPIMKRYTAGFRYYSWLAVILIFMIPFGGMGIKIDTSSVTAGVENEIRAAYYNLAPRRKENVEVTSKMSADYADISPPGSGEPIYTEEKPVTATVTYAEPVDILLILSAV